MGMFDEVYVNSSQLPVSEDERAQLKTEIFQTKSFTQDLFKYFITDEGRIEVERHHWRMVDEWPEDLVIFGRIRLTDAEGTISFYGEANGEWYEFEAYFRDGWLTGIKRVPERMRVSGRLTCTWTKEEPVG